MLKTIHGHHRFGFVALSGPPNVGKSTLLNRLVGKKISIMSRRPQTTRHRILGIKTMPHAQVVFIDTPGLHREQHNGLNRAINRTALASAADANLILFMIDVRGWNRQLETLFAQIAAHNRPVILLINKIDRLIKTGEREQLLPLIEQSSRIYAFQEIIPLSARKLMTLADTEAFLAPVIKALPTGAPGFPADQCTDRSRRFLAGELVREQTFRQLGKELPYASAVEITGFHETGGDAEDAAGDGLLKVAAVIWVEKASQKAIVIGHGGRQLKTIGQHARREMEKNFGTRVFLELWVKVRKNWADNAAMLKSLGYGQE